MGRMWGLAGGWCSAFRGCFEHLWFLPIDGDEFPVRRVCASLMEDEGSVPHELRACGVSRAPSALRRDGTE